MSDECLQPQQIKPADIFSNVSDLVKKLGGDAVCSTAAELDEVHASASGQESASANLGPASVQEQASFQASGGATHSNMNQSGCGTLVVAAQKIANNSSQINCILQKSSQNSSVDVGLNCAVNITTLPLTDKEEANKAKALADFDRTTTFANFSTSYINSMVAANVSLVKSNLPPLTIDASKAYSDARKAVADAYDRSIDMTDVNIGQTISGKIVIVQQLSSSDAETVASLSNEVTKSVAQAAIEQKSGANALAPSLKSVTDTSVNMVYMDC